MLADRTLALFGALALAGCAPTPHPNDAVAGPPVPVRIERVAPGGERGLVLPGRIKSAEEATLSARVAGRVSAFLVREGEVVRPGQPLVRFDAPEARGALEAARAEAQAAEVAAVVASRQQARMESLWVGRVVALADREAAEAADRSAAARLAAARAALVETESALEVRAPFAGVFVRRHVDPGADVAPGQPLADVRSAGGAEIVAAIPEAASRALAAGAEAQWGDGDWRAVRLASADGMVDPLTRSRTARFALPPDAPAEPGAFARVRLAGAADDGGAPISVSAGSVVRRGALAGVYVVEDGRAWLRWLRLGHEQGGRVDVLSGLGAGDQVVATPAGVRDGAAVRVGS